MKNTNMVKKLIITLLSLVFLSSFSLIVLLSSGVDGFKMAIKVIFIFLLILFFISIVVFCFKKVTNDNMYPKNNFSKKPINTYQPNNNQKISVFKEFNKLTFWSKALVLYALFK